MFRPARIATVSADSAARGALSLSLRRAASHSSGSETGRRQNRTLNGAAHWPRPRRMGMRHARNAQNSLMQRTHRQGVAWLRSL